MVDFYDINNSIGKIIKKYKHQLGVRINGKNYYIPDRYLHYIPKGKDNLISFINDGLPFKIKLKGDD